MKEIKIVFTTLSCSLPLMYSFWLRVLLPDTPFPVALSFYLSALPFCSVLLPILHAPFMIPLFILCCSVLLSVIFLTVSFCLVPCPYSFLIPLCCAAHSFYFLHLHPGTLSSFSFLWPAPTPSFCLSCSLLCFQAQFPRWGRWCCLPVRWFGGGLGSAGLMLGLGSSQRSSPA